MRMKIYLTTVEGHEGPLLCANSWEEAEQAGNTLGLEVVAEIPQMVPLLMSDAPVTLH
tara:strand:- start:161 stop:334 length:174 start_codon:yes stop_codon:yes gene_type:complete